MMKIIQKIGAKRIAVVLVLFVVAFLSINVFSKAASNPENHTKTIESLDEKKADVLKLTAASAAASAAIAAIPGDATTPVAMLMYGKVSQENYVELTAASAIPNKEIKSPQILRY